MVEQTVELCRSLGAREGEEILVPLARGACEQLSRRLRPGVRPADCAHVFPLAAAMLVLELLEQAGGEVSAFSAGEVTIRKEHSGSMARAAWQLLSPWCGESGFAAMGVRG